MLEAEKKRMCAAIVYQTLSVLDLHGLDNDTYRELVASKVWDAARDALDKIDRLENV